MVDSRDVRRTTGNEGGRTPGPVTLARAMGYA